MQSSYRERTVAPLAVLWRRTVAAEAERTRILPDGCLDLLWTDDQLVVAGPDPAARWHDSPSDSRYVGLRLFGGLGAAAVDVPAVDLVGRSVALEDVLPARQARALADRVREAPEAALQDWVRRRLARLDPTGPRVLAMARAGLAVRAMADELGCSSRQLQRRTVPLFGYGPRRLGRIVRLQTAIQQLRAGTALSVTAALSGYADQAHLTRETRALTGTTPGALRGG